MLKFLSTFGIIYIFLFTGISCKQKLNSDEIDAYKFYCYVLAKRGELCFLKSNQRGTRIIFNKIIGSDTSFTFLNINQNEMLAYISIRDLVSENYIQHGYYLNEDYLVKEINNLTNLIRSDSSLTDLSKFNENMCLSNDNTMIVEYNIEDKNEVKCMCLNSKYRYRLLNIFKRISNSN